MKLTTYPSKGTGSWWSDGGTLHSDWVRLALGHRRSSRTNSSSFLSVTEERAHASAGRIWLLPAVVVGKRHATAAEEEVTAAVDGG
jgi:hypothetical protein